jgi:hypothetical protein
MEASTSSNSNYGIFSSIRQSPLADALHPPLSPFKGGIYRKNFPFEENLPEEFPL